jgi:hypothetical protein
MKFNGAQNLSGRLGKGKGKCNTVSVQANTGPEWSRRVRFPYFIKSAINIHSCQPYATANFTSPKIFLVFMTVRVSVDPRAKEHHVVVKFQTTGNIPVRNAGPPPPPAVPHTELYTAISSSLSCYSCSTYRSATDRRTIYRATVQYNYRAACWWASTGRNM